jgi:transcriptional regulator with XRE-family HTH domain
MGQSRRPQPRRLASKLLRIRTRLGFTQEDMAKLVRHRRAPVYRSHISEFENGKREPSLLVLLAYARTAGVVVDVLIDDELNLN